MMLEPKNIEKQTVKTVTLSNKDIDLLFENEHFLTKLSEVIYDYTTPHQHYITDPVVNLGKLVDINEEQK